MRASNTISSVIIILLVLLSTTPGVFAATERITVSAGDAEALRFYLEDGDRIKFGITVSGGSNDDINISIKNPNGGIINEGLLTESFNNEILASTTGNYYFEFDNSFSLVSKKFVTFDYEIIKKPVFAPSSSASSAGFVVGIEWIALGALVLAIVIPVAIWKSRKKKVDESEVNAIDEPTLEIKEDLEKSQNENAVKILKERLAKGQISKEEYDKLKEEFE